MAEERTPGVVNAVARPAHHRGPRGWASARGQPTWRSTRGERGMTLLVDGQQREAGSERLKAGLRRRTAADLTGSEGSLSRFGRW